MDTTVMKKNLSDHLKKASFRLENLNLVRDDKGRPVWNTENALTVLRSHPEWQGVLAHNLFRMKRMLLGPIPGEHDGGYPRSFNDLDYVAAQAWFNRAGFRTASKDVVVDAMHKIASENSFDPLEDYLNELEWDKVQRLNRWLSTYCGAEESDYTAEIGLRWCISAVARGLHPGCKADHMIVFEGSQGARKSTALATLAGPNWFSDSLPPMQTKDASSFLSGRWIIEVAELEAMRRDVDAVKAFISRQVETYRPAYGREEVTEPRRCVFAGTTNKDDWQRDETGGRRFWPVKVGEINISALERDRDQLWAEAVTLYKNGERWWLEGDVVSAALAAAGERRPEDPWRTDIATIIDGLPEVTTKYVLAGLGFAPAEMTISLSKRVAAVFAGLGWRKSGRITSGDFKGAARFTPPSV